MLSAQRFQNHSLLLEADDFNVNNDKCGEFDRVSLEKHWQKPRTFLILPEKLTLMLDP